MDNRRINHALAGLLTATVVFATLGAAAAAVPGEGNRIPEGQQPGKQAKPILKVADHTVGFGGRFRLRGRTGNPYPGHVLIQIRDLAAWRTIGRSATDEQGRFRLKIAARRSATLRVVTGDSRVSRPLRVTVIGRLRVLGPVRYVRVGEKLVVRGLVLPRGSRRIRMRVRGEGTVTGRTGPGGRFRLGWKSRSNGDFSYRVRALPNALSKGDHSIRRHFSVLRPGHASYYGPGLYGNGVACGGTLTPTTRGVAHKTLPCGTRVTFQYGRRTVVAKVIDRGPYVAGRDWDLTEQTKKDLGFGGVGVVWTNR